MNRRWHAGVSVAGAALFLAGCGLGAGPGTSNVTLTVTRSFGAITVGRAIARRVPGSETVIRMLQRHFRVGTRYGGGFVESIDGLSGDSSQRDWFYYVNGIEASIGWGGDGVHQGDRVWWDLHDWSAPSRSPPWSDRSPSRFCTGAAAGAIRLRGLRLRCVGRPASGCPASCAKRSAVCLPGHRR